MSKNWFKIVVFVVVFLGIGAFFVFYKNKPEVIKEPIPTAQVYKSPKSTVTSKTIPAEPELITDIGSMPVEINLAVPFTVQAPYANWEDPYGDFCEEASVLMAASYVFGTTIAGPDFADQKMLEIKLFEEQRFGYHKDTSAEETATILREFYKIDKIRLVYNPTENDIKKALAEKKAVIIPAAGQQLGNPYFRQPGPLYHMLVIKGYTKEGNFITNDPGTKRGSDFIYSSSVIMNAIHDWNNGDIDNGRKVVIIVG
ncbi:MAG: hypothetical protein A3B86_03005 [Candidatus Yanofskybacteria bacterium RIFCSPHIGHO2_02_FULL_38_22b]|uniref:Peptidase C39-like domain-containing protein n=1 Tax=Candidatus Yanofskybacteria bacterium RIFCSPHIGHO2_02_FULL_38_22b TaxID=1802673 RepID=A0A1F8F123_9BACT|nr:MAG: hypothetical protein A2816_02600 [Candidatus Yanofskybacteria bacterium RIFCSPHIGHO2_01_FULL_39_44]OGN06841.1 MAG: hypothetical protein A3B86_03005 [Candidatus Yanofskybacteria bacterium RIFCSPHIGHO2_02_FULL_38_22b]OGN20736.1 MAG: hypothetical protein A2910_00965 [Candidatus Yanofskybacteria bacterium RIFCSPLOWO2_01_FULL_39_28]